MKSLNEAREVASRMFASDAAIASVVIEMTWGLVKVDRNLDCWEPTAEEIGG